MGGWGFKNVTDLLQKVPARPLGNAPYSLLDVARDADASFKVSALAISVQPTLGLKVLAFNSLDDHDADGVLAAAGQPTAPGELPPQLALTKDGAYLVYRTECAVKAQAGARLASLGFDLEATADASLTFADYRRHARATTVVDAIREDLSALPRYAVSLDSVRALQPGDAVSMRFAGRIDASVTIAWSDVMTAAVPALSRILRSRQPIALKMKAGASLTADVSLSDEFIVAFSRVDTASVRVAVRKARASAIGLTMSAGVSVEFADPQAVADAAMSLVDGVLGEATAKVDALLAQADLSSLSAAQRRVADLLLARLDLSPAATIEALRARVAEVRTKAHGAILKAAETKVSLGFTYEYRRLSQHVNLLQAVVSAEALDACHADVVKGHLAPLTQALAGKQKGYTLETYLNESTVVRSRSFGFTLGIGKWTIGGKDSAKRQWVVRTSLDGRHRQEAFAGVRAYEAKWIGQDFGWAVDLAASMPRFSSGVVPLVSEYEFGLHTLLQADDRTLSEKELGQWLDVLALWRICPEQEIAQARAVLAGAVGQSCSVTAQLTAGDEVVRRVLRILADHDVETLGDALGAAMPWAATPDERSRLSLRRGICGPLWRYYLKHPGTSRSGLAAVAENYLRERGHSTLAHVEARGAVLDSKDTATFAGLAHLNPTTASGCRNFVEGAGRLQRGIAASEANEGVIDAAFDLMNDLWEQSLHVRAVGVLLADAASQAGCLDQLGRSLTVVIRPKDGAKAQVVVVTS